MPYCTLCKSYFLKFVDFNKRPNVGCPVCHSAERHRLFGYYMDKYVNKGTLNVLHLAHEKIIYKTLDGFVKRYECGDLNPSNYKDVPCKKIDITQIQTPDNTYNFIIASHILEHIPDDKKALDELYRVLIPDGKLIVMVPQNFESDVTDEDLTITDPIIRTKKYGQYDHVRLYGLDLATRLSEAGFRVKAYIPATRVNEAKKMKLFSVEVIADPIVMSDNGFSSWDILYECTKI